MRDLKEQCQVHGQRSKNMACLGEVLSIMAYKGRRLRPKGVPFSGFRYIKG